KVVCDDDACGPGGGSQVTFSVTANATYMIRVTGFGTASGSFVMKIISGPEGYTTNDCNGDGTLDSCQPGAIGPVISQPPVSQGACLGGSVTLSVTATGAPTLSYQWRKNGGIISGATASSYTIDPVVAGSAGSYTVAVTNPCGTTTSSAAVVS